MAISIEFWKSSDGTIDVSDEFENACNGFPDKRSFFEATLESLAKRAARGQLAAGTFLLQAFIYEMLKKTALPDEVEEIVKEFEDGMKSPGPDSNDMKVRIEQLGAPWRQYWEKWTEEPVRQRLKDVLRILVTFRPPKESYVAYVPFASLNFNYEFVAKFDVVRDGMKTRVVYWRIEAF